MKLTLSNFVFVAFLVSGAASFSDIRSTNSTGDIDWSLHQWIAPGPNDARGPCPGLNTLANHGFLPRNGQNITVDVIRVAALEGYNIEKGVLDKAAKLGYLTTDAPTSFTLNDIKLHGTIEHDASLSRNDYALGDNYHFNDTIFQTLNNSNPGVDYYNTTSAGQVMQQRLADDIVANPNITNTIKEFDARIIESSLYLSVMGDPVTGVAPKQFVQIFFSEERLPIEEGWMKSTTVINGTTLSPVMDAIGQQARKTWQTSGGCPWIRLGPSGQATILPDPCS